jgi:hypothetical protein
MDFSRTPKSPIRLNHQESRRLVRALTSPPKPPTEAFLRGLKLYRETVISDVNPESPTYRLKESPDNSTKDKTL